MKPTRDKTNSENLRRTELGELDLICDWGGGDTKFMLYGRDKDNDFFIPIGVLEKPKTRLNQYPLKNKQCAEYILSHDNLIEGSIERLPYALIPISRSGVEHGIVPEKVKS